MREGGTTAGSLRQHVSAALPALRRARAPRRNRAGGPTGARALVGARRRTCICLCARACVLALAALVACAGCLAACSGSGSPGANGIDTAESSTSGPAFERPTLALSPFDADAATNVNGALIDTSHLAEGYVAVSATSTSRLKLEVAQGDAVCHYDLPNDGTPLSCPLTLGDGAYSFTVWENTSGNRYGEMASIQDVEVNLADEFQPFVRPSVYCDYDASSASTELADELCADAQNQGDALRAVYDWIVANIVYDEGKAATLADATGYVPSPDATIADGSGICFDYASLAAAMLRSQGIPCKIVTGNVSPDDIYHAWNMVYIDGTWIGTGIDVKQNTWTRIDTTFAAGSGSNYVGDGTSYTDRYTY